MKVRIELLMIAVLGLVSCRTTRPPAEVVAPASSRVTPALPPPQVVLAAAPDDLRGAPGGAVVTMTEAQRRDFFAARPPAFEAMPEPERGRPVVLTHRSARHATDFPLFWTLTYGGLGAIIGNQFGGRNGEGAAIGAGLGLMRDSVKWGD